MNKEQNINCISLFFILFYLATTPILAQITGTQVIIVKGEEYNPRILKEITLSGSGYELGLQHGRLLKDEIAEIVTRWKDNTSKNLGRNADEVIQEFFQYADFTSSIKKWTPELFEEVKGIAKGSSQKFNDIFILNLLDEFWVYLNSLSNHHCTTFGIPASEHHPAYVAQNMDIEIFTDRFQTLIRLDKTDKRPEQLIFTHPGLIALNGMNSERVGVVVNTLMQLNASNSGLPVAFIIRHIINTTNKEDLLQFIENVPHASGQNYIIGIKDEVFDFEASSNQVIRFNPANSNQSVYHTNHPLVNNDIKPWFTSFDPGSENTGKQLESNTHIRLDAIEKRIANVRVVNPTLIKLTLRSKDNELHPICRSDSASKSVFTFGSVIMELTDPPALFITPGPPDESMYKKISFTSTSH